MSTLNTEKILRLLNEIEPQTHSCAAYFELKAHVTEALHFEIAKQKGGKPEETRRRTALAYLKRDRKPNTPKYRWNSWIEDGYQIFTDAVTAFRFSDGHHIDGLPQISPEENHVPNTDKIFAQAADTTGETMINQKDLKIAIATWKAEGKQSEILRHPVGAAFYNAEALLETLKLLGVEEAAVKQREPKEFITSDYVYENDVSRRINRTNYSYYPGYIVLEGREALIMPVNPLKGKEEENDNAE
jgi:hypothetical protein